jgi:hypothetical protein
MLGEMTNFFGVILVPLRPPTARSHAPKSFNSPLKTPRFSLRFWHEVGEMWMSCGQVVDFQGGLRAKMRRVVDKILTGCGFWVI